MITFPQFIGTFFGTRSIVVAVFAVVARDIAINARGDYAAAIPLARSLRARSRSRDSSSRRKRFVCFTLVAPWCNDNNIEATIARPDGDRDRIDLHGNPDAIARRIRDAAANDGKPTRLAIKMLNKPLRPSAQWIIN